MANDQEPVDTMDPEDYEAASAGASAAGSVEVLPPDPPTVVVQPKARAKRAARPTRSAQGQAQAAPEPPPEPPRSPTPPPEPKRRARAAPKAAPKAAPEAAPAPKAARGPGGRFLPRNPEAEASPPQAPVQREEEDTPFASLARALHNARQNYAAERQMLYQSFVHG